jgi:hypothetical protein
LLTDDWLCAVSGLHVPVYANSRGPVFEQCQS